MHIAAVSHLTKHQSVAWSVSQSQHMSASYLTAAGGYSCGGTAVVRTYVMWCQARNRYRRLS